MAKPYQNATQISIILTVIAMVGVALGLLLDQSLIILFLLLPTIGYEVYRTEGDSTRFSSLALLGVSIAEILMIIFNVKFDLIKFFGVEEKYVAGYSIPLGDIKVVGPAVIAILSVILFTRTYGKYTKWLSAVIFIAAFAVIYTLDHTLFKQLSKLMIDEGINRI